VYEEYVVGSHMSFVRNPNYWKSTTINGVAYQLPFLDRVVLPIIPDESTRIAALRTGMLELFRSVPLAHWDTVDKIAPQLVQTTFLSGGSKGVRWNYSKPPFNDIRVRRACFIGTNAAEFAKLGNAEGMERNLFPYVPGAPCHVPLEELPEDLQILYDYNPELARQLLDEAGIPERLTVDFYIGQTLEDVDIASLLADQWAKIGIDLNIITLDNTAYVAMIYPMPEPKYAGACIGGSSADPILYLAQQLRSGGSGGSANKTNYSNPMVDELIDQIMLELNPAEQTRLLKEAGDIIMHDVVEIPLNPVIGRIYWWPWVKNYYGEFTIADDMSFCPLVMYMWIDQDLMAEMGFK